MAILLKLIFVDDDFKTPDNEVVGGITALLGLVFGIIISFSNDLNLVMIAVYSFVGAVIGMIAGAVLSWAGGVFLLCLNLLALSGFPIYWLILSIPKNILEKKIKSFFPGWKNDDGSPLVKLSSDGLGGISCQQRSIYVAAKNLRRNGKSQDFGIPKFSFAELQNTGQVNLKMNVAAAVFASGAIVADMVPEHQWVNPTTGLPLIGNLPGGIDVGGNYWGEVTNSETGLEHVNYDSHES